MVVWHNAPNEVGIGRVEGGQKLVKLRPERRGDSFEDLRSCVLSLFLLLRNLLGLARMISEEIDNKHVLTLLHLIDLESSELVMRQLGCKLKKPHTTVSLH